MADQAQRNRAHDKAEETKQCAQQKLGQAQQSAKVFLSSSSSLFIFLSFFSFILTWDGMGWVGQSMAGSAQDKIDEAGRTAKNKAEDAKEQTGSLLPEISIISIITLLITISISIGFGM